MTTVKLFGGLLDSFMAFMLLIMVGCPGLYDTQRRSLAYKHHNDSPSETTRMEIVQAKKEDRRDIVKFEIISAAVFTTAFFLRRRLERNIDS
ncbi:MAG: hypothetical protein ABI042_07215 [Verrucomicrobiota bacterium]